MTPKNPPSPTPRQPAVRDPEGSPASTRPLDLSPLGPQPQPGPDIPASPPPSAPAVPPPAPRSSSSQPAARASDSRTPPPPAPLLPLPLSYEPQTFPEAAASAVSGTGVPGPDRARLPHRARRRPDGPASRGPPRGEWRRSRAGREGRRRGRGAGRGRARDTDGGRRGPERGKWPAGARCTARRQGGRPWPAEGSLPPARDSGSGGEGILPRTPASPPRAAPFPGLYRSGSRTSC